MRILMFVPAYLPCPVGGLERQAHLLARELSERGDSVHVLTLDGARVGSQRRFEGIGISRLVTSGWADQAKQLTGWLFQFAKHFDVCHVQGMSNVSVFVANVCRARGVPTLVKLPNCGPAGIPGMLERRFGWLWRQGFMRADAVVAMAAANLRELEAIRFPRARVFCASNGVRLPRTVRDHRNNTSSPVFLFAGRLDPGKGVRDLAEAWDRAHPDLPASSRLRFLGDGPLKAELAELAARDGLAGSIDMAGWLPSAIPEYAKADVCVLPSYAEGNSNTILEAMAAGLPIVATDVGGTRMLVGPDGASNLVAPGDVPGLARRLVQIGRDRDGRGRLGAAMRRRAERNFSVRAVAEAYARAYKALAHGRRDDVHSCSLVSLEDR
jgi:glycosyltransferase involved in cell wall biosynthesis